MNSPLAYVGGKSKVANRIIQMMPKHLTYCEVFAGGASVFFIKQPSKFEIINDLDGDLINFFRVIQHHYEEFCRHFECLLPSKELYDDYLCQLQHCRGLTDIQRAVRFYYVQGLTFSGKIMGRSWARRPQKRSGLKLWNLDENIRMAHERLKKVVIENDHYEKFIGHYDKPETFFYCDPPYYGVKYYNHNFEDDEFAKLAGVLSGIKGKFMMSINDSPEIREIYSNFNIQTIELPYSMNRNLRYRCSELIITNYDQNVCLNGMADPDVSKTEKTHNKKNHIVN